MTMNVVSLKEIKPPMSSFYGVFK